MESWAAEHTISENKNSNIRRSSNSMQRNLAENSQADSIGKVIFCVIFTFYVPRTSIWRPQTQPYLYEQVY